MKVVVQTHHSKHSDSEQVECRLVIIFEDQSIDVIDFFNDKTIPEANHIVYVDATESNKKCKIYDFLDLPLHMIINFNLEPLNCQAKKVETVFLWYALKGSTLKVDILSPSRVSIIKKNVIFTQLYPENPSGLWVDVGNIEPLETFDQICEFLNKELKPTLGTSHKKPEENSDTSNEKELNQHADAAEEVETTQSDVNVADKNITNQPEQEPTDDAVWEIFTKDDMISIVENFISWKQDRSRSRSSGQFLDRLARSLIDKLGNKYTIKFWTSDTGYQKLVLDSNPLADTLMIGIINQQQQGLGYCLSRTSNIDHRWQYKTWYIFSLDEAESIHNENEVELDNMPDTTMAVIDNEMSSGKQDSIANDTSKNNHDTVEHKAKEPVEEVHD